MKFLDIIYLIIIYFIITKSGLSVNVNVLEMMTIMTLFMILLELSMIRSDIKDIKRFIKMNENKGDDNIDI